jgi:hypothetical protein
MMEAGEQGLSRMTVTMEHNHKTHHLQLQSAIEADHARLWPTMCNALNMPESRSMRHHVNPSESAFQSFLMRR